MKFLFSFGCILAAFFFQSADKNYLLGKFNPATDSRFVQLKSEHTSGAAINGFLRTETYDAFVRMSEASKREGIRITIISATRNFESQKTIWENKWNGRTLVGGKKLTSVFNPAERAKIILHYSSMPGSSRHHWGTDMDLNSLENSYFESGEGQKIYQWLQAHASEFGFCQPYTSKENGRSGYEEEKWHWSYLPLARDFLNEYLKNIHYDDFGDFEGFQTAKEIGIIENYVGGVACTEVQR